MMDALIEFNSIQDYISLGFAREKGLIIQYTSTGPLGPSPLTPILLL